MKNPIDLKYLKLAAVLDETGSLTQSARRLHLSQPAISHQLKALEGLLGVALFERQGKRMVANSAGKYLSEKGKTILEAAESLFFETQEMARGESSVLRISTSCFTCYHWLPQVLKQFSQSYPHVAIEIKPEATADVYQHLRDDNVDLGIVVCNSAADLFYQPLFQDEILLLVPRDHILAKQSEVEIAETVDEPWIYYQGTQEAYETYFFQVNGCSIPEKTTQLGLTEIVIEWVAAGLGVTAMARWIAQPYLERKDLVGIPLSNHNLCNRQWYTASRYENIPSSWLYFIDLLRESLPVGKGNEL